MDPDLRFWDHLDEIRAMRDGDGNEQENDEAEEVGGSETDPEEGHSYDSERHPSGASGSNPQNPGLKKNSPDIPGTDSELSDEERFLPDAKENASGTQQSTSEILQHPSNTDQQSPNTGEHPLNITTNTSPPHPHNADGPSANSEKSSGRGTSQTAFRAIVTDSKRLARTVGRITKRAKCF